VNDRRRAWLPARVATAAFVGLAVATGVVLASRLVGGRTHLLLASHTFTVTVGYATTFVVACLAAGSLFSRAAGGWDASRAAAFRSAAIGLSAAALALTLVGVALGAWWAGGHLGRYWGWDVKEVGGLCVLAWNGVIYWAVRRPRMDPANGTAAAVGVAADSGE
jgi:Cytochrome C assembly protein